MDSFIANGITVSSNASNLHVEWGRRSASTASWDVSGYQDSSCVLVSICIIGSVTLTCIAPKDNQTYFTELSDPHSSDNSYYAMSVVFKKSGTVSIEPSHSMSLGGRVTEYMIIGIP